MSESIPQHYEFTLLLVTHEPDSTSSVNVKAVEVRSQFKWLKNDPSGLNRMFYI